MQLLHYAVGQNLVNHTSIFCLSAGRFVLSAVKLVTALKTTAFRTLFVHFFSPQEFWKYTLPDCWQIFVVLCWHMSKNTYEISFRILHQILPFPIVILIQRKATAFCLCNQKQSFAVSNTSANGKILKTQMYKERSMCGNALH